MGASKGLKRAKPFPLTPISRHLFAQNLIILIEGFLPALMVMILGFMSLFVMGQWGLAGPLRLELLSFPIMISPTMPVVMVTAILMLYLVLKRVRLPKDRALWGRLADDNGLSYQDVLGLRHTEGGHGLKLRRPRAYLSFGDPFALRYALILAMALGFWLKGSDGFSKSMLDGFAAVTLGLSAIGMG